MSKIGFSGFTVTMAVLGGIAGGVFAGVGLSWATNFGFSRAEELKEIIAQKDKAIESERVQASKETNEAKLKCPYCDESLVLPVNEPFGEESYQCRECSGAFEVDWGEGQVRYSSQ